MATLARLMSEYLPLIIEPEKYAESGEQLEGNLALKDMARLSDLIQNRNGQVNFELTFSRDNRGWLHARGRLSTCLKVQCQRCLEEMTLELHNPIHVAIVNDQQEVELLPGNLEPFLAEDKKVSLIKMIEEELILALPLSPLHKEEECPATHTIQTHRSERDSPFAVLKNLKNSNT